MAIFVNSVQSGYLDYTQDIINLILAIENHAIAVDASLLRLEEKLEELLAAGNDGGLSRATTIHALRKTGQLADVSAEMVNPTTLPLEP
jgi:hypothetical protein